MVPRIAEFLFVEIPSAFTAVALVRTLVIVPAPDTYTRPLAAVSTITNAPARTGAVNNNVTITPGATPALVAVDFPATTQRAVEITTSVLLAIDFVPVTMSLTTLCAVHHVAILLVASSAFAQVAIRLLRLLDALM